MGDVHAQLRRINASVRSNQVPIKVLHLPRELRNTAIRAQHSGMGRGKAKKRTGLLGVLSRTGEKLYNVRRRIATVAVVILAVLLGYHVIFGRNGLTAFRDKRHDLRDLRSEASTLQRENMSLQGHVDRLTNDPNAIEHQAREDLHYTRPGEVIVTMPASSYEAKDKH